MILSPLASCCVFAALCTGLLVCCGPERLGCVRSEADPSPSAPGEVSSAGPSAVSGPSGAPPTVGYMYTLYNYDLFYLRESHLNIISQTIN